MTEAASMTSDAAGEAIRTPEEIESETMSLPRRASGITISDPASFEQAGSFLRAVKLLRAEVEDVFGPIVRAAHAAWKAALDQRKRVEAPMEEAERTVKVEIARWTRIEADRIRREQLEAEAEARRREEERRIEEAVSLEALGDSESAERVLEEPSVLVLPPPPQAMARATGISTREVWSARVKDLRALVRAVADGRAPIECLKADTTTLNQMARALKGSLAIPGVEPVCETSVSARASA